MIHVSRRQAGFTLIELIMYIGIVSLILLSISYLMLEILGSGSKSRAQQEVNQNVRVISAAVMADIRQASDISSLTGDTLVLALPGDDVTYFFDDIAGTLTRQLGSGDPVVIHSDEVVVNGEFSDLSYLLRAKNVGVHIMVSYKNPQGLPEFNASTTVDVAAELRGRK